MNKRSLDKLIEIEAELREANLKVFSGFSAVSTKIEQLTRLVRKLKEKQDVQS